MDVARTHPRARLGLRLLLVLLLTASPLWPFALASPMPPGGGGIQPQVPCHTGGGDLAQGAQATPDHHCPHCSGDAPASQCHCAQAAPGALDGSGQMASLRGVDSAPQHHLASDALPDSPGESLYRPPIFHA